MHLDDAGFIVEAAPLRRSVLEHKIGLAWLVDDPVTAWHSGILSAFTGLVARRCGGSCC